MKINIKLAIPYGLGLLSLLVVVASFASMVSAAPGKPGNPDSISVPHVKGEVLVKFRSGVMPAEQAAIHASARGKVEARIPDINVYLIRGVNSQSTEALIKAYSKNRKVEFVEPNVIFEAIAVPNDTHYPELWGMDNSGQTGGTADADIDAPEAWDITTGSSSVIIADIDSGVDHTHLDLKNNIWSNSGENPNNSSDDDNNGYINDTMGWDFVNNDNDPMDDFGHGTHTAGTFAAEGNNRKGVVGVSWNSLIMPLKFLSAGGSGSSFNAASAVLYASAMGAKVSNNSWGCGGDPGCYSQTLKDAIDVANTRGMLFVAAAGNDGADNDSRIFYPCNYASSNVICVAATDHNDLLASFSNFGGSNVDLSAPGVTILSTVPKSLDSSGYAAADGTSMATPHVAGAAALLLSIYPDLTPAEVKDLLMSSVDPLPGLSGVTVAGGRLNAYNALTANNFSIYTAPSNMTLAIGGSSSATLSVRSLSGFNSEVNLAVVSQIPGMTVTLTDTALTPPSGGITSTNIAVETAVGVAVGTYEIEIEAVDGVGETHRTFLTIDVQGAAGITVDPGFRRVAQGGSAEYTVTIDSLNGNSAPVNLNLVSLEPGITGSFSPNPVTPPAGGSVTSTLTINAAGSTPVGDAVLTVEGNDGSDYRVTTTKAEVVDTDLVLTSIGTDRTTAPAEGTLSFQIETEVLNQAQFSNAYRVDNPNYPIYITMYLSEDNIITNDDIYLGVRSISKSCGPFCTDYTISAGESQYRNGYVDVPDTTLPGTYYVGAIVDVQGYAPETNTTNNAILGPTIEITNTIYENMDLIMTAVSGPATGELDGNITISHTVHNQGTGPSDRSKTGIYLSTDPIITLSDTRLTEVEVAEPFNSGESRSYDTTVTILGTLPPGTYYIAAIADWRNWNAELDETNNTLVGNTITITEPALKPDLVISEVSGPKSARQHSTIDVTVSELNQGVGTANQHSFQIFLSTDPVITTADTPISIPYIVTQLGSGESYSNTFSLYISTSIPPGSYYIGAIADVNNDELEDDESNNTLTGDTITIREFR